MAKIKIRSSCSGTVHIASLIVGRKVAYETRAWGNAQNAIEDAMSVAAARGIESRAIAIV